MRLFLIWIGLAFLVVGGYCVWLWIRNRSRSRFRSRLTILFLVFTLLPAIPLTFLSASLLSRSVEVLLLPQIGSALESALWTLRTQIEARGRQFLETHPDPMKWTEQSIAAAGIASGGRIRIDNDTPEQILQLDCPRSTLSLNWIAEPQFLDQVMENGTASELVEHDTCSFMIIAQKTSDNAVTWIACPINRQTIQAKDEINRAVTIYNTLSLFKDSILQKNIIWALAVLLVAGLALFAVFNAKNLSRGVSEPVHELVAGMRQIADGNLDAEVKSDAKDEFKFLISTFNQMTSDLKDARNKLIMAERTAAREETARRISHEMKNSLTPISIALHKLSKQLVDNKDVESDLNALEEEFQLLQNMAASFAEFARMPTTEKSLLQLNDIALHTARFMEAAAEGRKIKTIFYPDLPEIVADREQIKRLLNNLIQNALDASKSHTTVTVSTDFEPGSALPVHLEIQDQGSGMDEDQLKQVFNPYFTTKASGTGLGLTIVRRIVDDHEGEISIKSAPGQGTRIIIQFPVSS